MSKTLCVLEMEHFIKNNDSASLQFSKLISYDNNKIEKKETLNNAIGLVKSKIFEASLDFHNTEKIVMKLGGRLIINHASGVLENAGLAIHRNLGYPYIPGSAVKGVVAHYAWGLWHNCESQQEKVEIAKNIALVFGFPTSDKKLDAYIQNLGENFLELYDRKERSIKDFSGSIAFFAAKPKDKANLSLDVLTCHHMDYYGGKKGKALDNENPNPQYFPVVESGVSFMFQLLPLKNIGKKLLEKTKMWLIDALQINGIGAKTSTGYGWFEIDQAILREQEVIRKKKEEEETRKAEEKRLANLTPEEKVIEELKKVSEEFLKLGLDLKKAKMRDINALPENEQKIVLNYLLENEEGQKVWISEKTGNDKAKKRVENCKTIAKQLGVNLV